jgi:hypothetical protein
VSKPTIKSSLYGVLVLYSGSHSDCGGVGRGSGEGGHHGVGSGGVGNVIVCCES